jgi:imidazolonepropionase-like amidohydrolase
VNESGQAVTSECRISDVTNPDPVNWYQQLAGGVTAVNNLHGSANAIGGQSQTNKIRWGCPTPDDMHFDSAAPGIKFALGENPRRANGPDGNTRYPTTRMGVEMLIRDRFTAAAEYRKARGTPDFRPDMELEPLAEILDGKRLVHSHAYRQDEMLMLALVARDFGFRIGTYQHALEGYKVADYVRDYSGGASGFADWWAFKMEVQDAIPEAFPIMAEQGVTVSYNSDSNEMARRLNAEAAKAVKYSNVSEEEALKYVTLNPAKQLGIDSRVGSLEEGKDADIAIWDGTPLSTQAKCVMTMIEGEVFFERRDAFGIDKASTAKQHLDRKMNNWEGTTLPRKSNSYVIQGATIHTISGEDITDGSVVIENGKITGVGKSVKIPAGASIVNARGQHVFPGFFDANSSIGLAEIGPIPVMNDNREFGIFNP